jgi:hypothetical protein
MSKKKAAPSGAETAALDAGGDLVEVRALVDNSSLGLVCGRLARVPAAAVACMAAAAQVDPHPDAVAYARSLEAPAQEA